MLNFFKKDPVPPTTADRKLQQLKDLLFPEPKLEMENDMEFYVDSSVDMNIEAVLYDLEEGHNDDVCQNTLRSIANTLFNARKLLQAYYEMDSNINHVVVTDPLPKIKEEIDH